MTRDSGHRGSGVAYPLLHCSNPRLPAHLRLRFRCLELRILTLETSRITHARKNTRTRVAACTQARESSVTYHYVLAAKFPAITPTQLQLQRD